MVATISVSAGVGQRRRSHVGRAVKSPSRTLRTSIPRSAISVGGRLAGDHDDVLARARERGGDEAADATRARERDQSQASPRRISRLSTIIIARGRTYSIVGARSDQRRVRRRRPVALVLGRPDRPLGPAGGRGRRDAGERRDLLRAARHWSCSSGPDARQAPRPPPGGGSGRGGRQVAVVDAQGRAAAHREAASRSPGHVAGTASPARPTSWSPTPSGRRCWRRSSAAEAPLDATGCWRRSMRPRPRAVTSAAASRRRSSSYRRSASRGARPFLLRVEDHPDPLPELRRLITLHEAYELADQADGFANEGRHDKAAEAFQKATALAPDNHELLFWAGLGAAYAGDLEAGAGAREGRDRHPASVARVCSTDCRRTSRPRLQRSPRGCGTPDAPVATVPPPWPSRSRPSGVPQQLRAFVDLPFRLHAGTPWIPPLKLERYLFLTRRLNPYFTHGEAEYFLARRDGRVVGRDHGSGRSRVQRLSPEPRGGCSASSSSRTTRRCSTRCSSRGRLAARARLRADGRADGLSDERRERRADRGLRARADDQAAVAPAVLPAALRGGRA